MKNYYAILGISQNETPSGIRAAYRDAVRRTHPDYAGPQSASAFADVVEAHSVLSDPNRRRDYNERLRLEQLDNAVPVRSDSVPDRKRGEYAPWQGMPENLRRFYAGRAVRPATSGLSVEIILTPEEAARGGAVSINIPLREKCGRCDGTGEDWFFPCPQCGGQGGFSRMQPLRLVIPEAIRLGRATEIALEPLRIDNLVLKLRLSVPRERWY